MSSSGACGRELHKHLTYEFKLAANTEVLKGPATVDRVTGSIPFDRSSIFGDRADEQEPYLVH